MQDPAVLETQPGERARGERLSERFTPQRLEPAMNWRVGWRCGWRRRRCEAQLRNEPALFRTGQDEARRIPDLVGEMAARLDVLDVEEGVLSRRRQHDGREAH